MKLSLVLKNLAVVRTVVFDRSCVRGECSVGLLGLFLEHLKQKYSSMLRTLSSYLSKGSNEVTASRKASQSHLSSKETVSFEVTCEIEAMTDFPQRANCLVCWTSHSCGGHKSQSGTTPPVRVEDNKAVWKHEFVFDVQITVNSITSELKESKIVFIVKRVKFLLLLSPSQSFKDLTYLLGEERRIS